MLNHFLKVAYARSQAEEDRSRLHNLLKQLPIEDLYKLASGELTKEALLAAESSLETNEPKTWIDKFKGTPLFDQAVGLEQEEIQLEMDQLQKRQEERAMKDTDSSAVWDLKDQMRLKKKLLDVQLAQLDVTGQMPMEEEPPMEDPNMTAGAMAPPPKPLPTQPEQTAPKPPSAPPAEEPKATPEKDKMAAAEKIAAAEDMGRRLARQDFQKEARVKELLALGDETGRALTKMAFGMAGLQGLGRSAMNFAKANPGAAIGAGVGAVGGMAKGLQKDPQTGQRSLLKGVAGGVLGGAAGGAAGHAAQGIGSRVVGGQGLRQAAGNYANEVKGGFSKTPSVGSLKQQSTNYAASVPSAPVGSMSDEALSTFVSQGSAAKPPRPAASSSPTGIDMTRSVPTLSAPNATTPAPSRASELTNRARNAVSGVIGRVMPNRPQVLPGSVFA